MKITTHSNGIFDIKIAPGQDKFACALIDAPIQIYDIETGQLQAEHVDANRDSAWSMEWFRHEEKDYLLAGYGTMGYVRIIDANGTDKLAYIKKSTDIGYPNAAQLHSSSVWKIRVINNESCSVADDGTFSKLTLEFNTEKDSFIYTRKHEKRVAMNDQLHDFCPLNDTQFLIAGKYGILETTKRFSRAYSGIYRGHTEKVISVCKTSDTQFVSAGWDNTIILWNIGTYTPAQTVSLEEVAYNLIVADNKIFHTAGSAIIIRNKETLEISEKIEVGETNLRCFDLSADKKTLVAGDTAGNIYLKKL